MSSWQRRARLVIGIFALVFGVSVLLTIRERPKSANSVLIDRADPNAVVETMGSQVKQTMGSEESFKIEAERQLTYEDGSVRLVEVTISVPEGVDSEEFIVSGREGQISKNQKTARVTGDVKLNVNNGLRATAETASYDDREKIVRMSGAVTVERQTIQASAVGATYEGNQDILRLLKKAIVSVFGETNNEGLDIRADSAILADRDELMRFEGGVTMISLGKVIRANAALVHLRKEMTQVEMIQLYGNSRLTRKGRESHSLSDMGADEMTIEYSESGKSLSQTTLSGSAVIRLTSSDGTRQNFRPGSLRDMNADNIILEYAADGRSLSRAVLTGSALIRLEGPRGHRPRRIMGQLMDITLGPDGFSVTNLEVEKDVQVDFPGSDDGPGQRIQAASLEGKGEVGVGLTGVHFDGDVAYYETDKGRISSANIERVTRSRELDITVKPGFSSIEEARFTGDVRFNDGPVIGEAEKINSSGSGGVVELIEDPVKNLMPRVVDGNVSVTASRIMLVAGDGRIVAEGDVQSVLQRLVNDDNDGNENELTDRRKLPSMLDEEKAMYITGAHFERSSETDISEYTGEARLWQGDTEVRAEKILLDEVKGNLNAIGSVETKLPGIRRNLTTGKEEPTVVLGWGEELVFDDTIGQTTYTTFARVDGPAGDLRADKIEIHGGGPDNALERVEAYGAVTVELIDRWASGDRLTYIEEKGRYVLLGSPVKIFEQLAIECRETTGRTLTFFKQNDVITVDGNSEVRTESSQTTSGTCPEPVILIPAYPLPLY